MTNFLKILQQHLKEEGIHTYYDHSYLETSNHLIHLHNTILEIIKTNKQPPLLAIEIATIDLNNPNSLQQLTQILKNKK